MLFGRARWSWHWCLWWPARLRVPRSHPSPISSSWSLSWWKALAAVRAPAAATISSRWSVSGPVLNRASFRLEGAVYHSVLVSRSVPPMRLNKIFHHRSTLCTRYRAGMYNRSALATPAILTARCLGGAPTSDDGNVTFISIPNLFLGWADRLGINPQEVIGGFCASHVAFHVAWIRR